MVLLKKKCFSLFLGVSALLQCIQVVYVYRHADFEEVSIISLQSPLNLDDAFANSSIRAASVAPSSGIKKARWHADDARQKAHFVAHQTNLTGLEMRPYFLGYRRPTSNKTKEDDISIVTQCSINKFPRLLDLASRWNGYISVAVYIVGPQHEADLEKLTTLYNKHAAALLDAKVSFHLVINRGKEDMEHHYPHNIMRNMAMDHASTDFAFVLDVDFIPSVDAHAQLLSQLRKLDLRNEKQALIVPAFEQLRQKGKPNNNNNITVADLPPNKKALKREMRSKPEVYRIFHENFYPGHGPTNFKKWYKTKHAYSVEYELFFEPYVVVNLNSERLPRFWEHFTGFGLNKQSWIEELAVAGYEFIVVPDSFIIHMHHKRGPFSSRIVRPAMVNEYAYRFVPYLNRTYGYSYWEDDDPAEYIG